MTRTYALQMLLEHGPLTWPEILEITGWRTKIAASALRRLCHMGSVMRVPQWRQTCGHGISRKQKTAYALSSSSTTHGSQLLTGNMPRLNTDESGGLCHG
jgi:hypothetical protein